MNPGFLTAILFCLMLDTLIVSKAKQKTKQNFECVLWVHERLRGMNLDLGFVASSFRTDPLVQV